MALFPNLNLHQASLLLLQKPQMKIANNNSFANHCTLIMMEYMQYCNRTENQQEFSNWKIQKNTAKSRNLGISKNMVRWRFTLRKNVLFVNLARSARISANFVKKKVINLYSKCSFDQQQAAAAGSVGVFFSTHVFHSHFWGSRPTLKEEMESPIPWDQR